MPKSRSLKKDAEIAVIPGNPLVLRGARNVRTLSAAFIADLQEDWEKYGTQILELMREKFPDLYFASIVKLAQIVRIEADVSLKEPKPKTNATPEGHRLTSPSSRRLFGFGNVPKFIRRAS